MKGQNLRLFLGPNTTGTKPIAKAQECSVHIGVQTENDSSKDNTDDWNTIDVVGKSWDASATCDFESTDSSAVTVAQVIGWLGTKLYLQFAPASGANNRTKGTDLLKGYCYITDIQIQSTNKQKVTATVQFTGSGSLS